MEKLRTSLESIFSSNKRTSAILVIFSLILALPITLSFLGQQQDIRQRAQETVFDSITDVGIDPCPLMPEIFCPAGQTRINTNPQDNCPVYECVTSSPTAIPTCSPRPACLDTKPYCYLPEPVGGWCETGGTVCPADAKLCPNGSYVSRSGPECQFAPCPTLTPTATLVPTTTLAPSTHPREVRINLFVQLTGIGNATGSASGLNNNPKRMSRHVDVDLYNSQNRNVSSRNGALHYDSRSGLYKGTVTLGASFQSGPHVLKMRFDNSLWKQVPGIVNITHQQDNNIFPVKLVSGDINQDGEINLADYARFYSCYGIKPCEAKIKADLNDDGKVDELDINILLSSLSKRHGD